MSSEPDDIEDIEDTLNLFNPHLGVGKYVYEDQKMQQKKEGGGGKKDHQGARDKKFRFMMNP